MKFLSSSRSRFMAKAIGHGLRTCGFFLLLAVGVQAQDAQTKTDPQEQKLQAALEQFAKAFNAHDAKAVANLWQENAVHRQSAFAGSLEGRTAILEAYDALFKSDPKAQLDITLNSFRVISPNVVSAKCSTQVVHTDQSASFSRLSALLVKQGDQWLISEVEETDVPVSVTTPASYLQGLNWLVGTWVDTSEKSVVSNHVHWANGGNFLVREYHLATPQGFASSGTQIIGWDSEQKVIRCWQFDGDGSFGKGTFEQTSPTTWRCPMTVKLTDGRRASFTQVIEQTAENELSLSIVNMEVDGQAFPDSGPDKLVRQGS